MSQSDLHAGSETHEWFSYFLMVRPPRLQEALWATEYCLEDLEECERRVQLNAARLVDDRLEEAISHRDDMRQHQRNKERRRRLFQFTTSFPHICYSYAFLCPLELEAIAMRVRLYVARTGGSRSIFESKNKLLEVVGVLREAAESMDNLRYSTLVYPSVLLLQSMLTDLSRMAMHYHVHHDADGVVRLPPDNATSLFATKLLHAVRSTVAHRVSDKIRASVALTVAELLSFYDRTLSIGPLPSIERKPCVSSELRCYLTGAKLSPDEMVSMEGGHNVASLPYAYWVRITSQSVT